MCKHTDNSSHLIKESLDFHASTFVATRLQFTVDFVLTWVESSPAKPDVDVSLTMSVSVYLGLSLSTPIYQVDTW
jgi:hypothetical protein